VFEVEPGTNILRKHGTRVRLQEQPFRVLLALLEKPGEPVTREELQRQIWAGNTFGDFEHSLNIAVNKIRDALGDSAENPRFVETLPRRGYRFIAPVEGVVAPQAAAPVKAPLSKWVPVSGAVVAVVALIAGIAAWRLPPDPPELELRRLTNDSSAKVGPVLSDGTRLYFGNGPKPGLVADVQVHQLPASGGEPSSLPFVPPVGRYVALLDITPEGRELLMVTFERGFQPEAAPLWAMRIADGSSRRVGGLLASQASYSPDGKEIAFTAGGIWAPGSLSVASTDGSNVRRLVELNGLAIVNPCWSPDGKRIAFGQLNQAVASAWEVMADGTRLRRLFPDWHESHLPVVWTLEDHLLLNSRFRFWTVQEAWFGGGARRVQLSSGEPQFSDQIQPRSGRTFYAVGITPLGQLQRFDTRSGTWEPHLGGISAEHVEYSRDGQKLIYTTYPGAELWIRGADGSRQVRLTAAPMQVNIARWSPDGRVIAFMGRSTPDQPWRIYLVDAAGGSVRLPCPKNCGPQGDFAWAPDGKKIVYSFPGGSSTEDAHLWSLNLGTGEVTTIPGSDGLYSPRWSPDGTALAALMLPLRRGQEVDKDRPLMLYRFSEGKWKELSNGRAHTGWPSWSHDSKSIWYVNYARAAIMRCDVRENRHKEITRLGRKDMTGAVGTWFNLTPNDEPMILRRHDIEQIYSMEWKAR
jgi:Tol biopolymer transport system component/DNA-binding winged helix-turn-helix (wHTH) protein